MFARFNLEQIRKQFPALSRVVNNQPAIFFDGPAGSQVPRSVAVAVSRYLLNTNANHEGPFATSRESDYLLDQAHATVADFLGTFDPDCIAFGANMTTLTLSLSRAIGRTWNRGDEVIVTHLDHDANVTPWVLAAQDAGVTVHHINVDPEDCTLDLDDFRSKLSPRTKLVALGYASNVTGTINPIHVMIEQAHAVGALVFIDAVHSAPHRLIDVIELDCDFLACSAYKFFGPHVGILYGKRNLLEQLPAYKLRPASDDLPDKWMTGTQNHEGIVGTAAAIEYLADLSRTSLMVETSSNGEPKPNRGIPTKEELATESPVDSIDRRNALVATYSAIKKYERELVARLLDGLSQFSDIRIWGITNSDRLDKRVPTVSFTHARQTPQKIAEQLAEKGIFTWPGNHYALPFTEIMGLEPEGTLRIGLLHYNTANEVDRLLETLHELQL